MMADKKKVHNQEFYSEALEGLIIKGIGGFYYVEAADTVYTCIARGKFRKQKVTPYAGDHVKIFVDDDKTGYIDKIADRKNYLFRPPVANIDRLFIISSIIEPSPDTQIIDKSIAAAELKGIEPILIITKTDMNDADTIEWIYSKAGIKVVSVSSVTNEGIGEVGELLQGCISAFTGNSGVGKSTLLNAIFPNFDIKTAEISQKLGRGKHTTRDVELYKIGENAYVADTPGFSSFDSESNELIDKDNLVFGFREFESYLGKCKFTSCSHTCEKGCEILRAVNEGEITKSRHESYKAIYNEVKDIKPWQTNRNV